MWRLFPLILYHFLGPLTSGKMMQSKNPSANILHLISNRASEKMSQNEITVGKLDTEEYYVRKLVISSEQLAYLLETMQLILDILAT